MKDVVTVALELRAKAEAGPVGKRGSSFRLYSLLGECYRLALHCKGSPPDLEAVRALIAQGPLHGRNRTFAEKGSSAFLIVCRFVFRHDGASADRANSSRYGKALEEAHFRKIKGDALVPFLRTQGGINALFLARPLARRTVETKTLYLNRSIEVPKGEAFTLNLRRLPNGQFEVLKHEVIRRAS